MPPSDAASLRDLTEGAQPLSRRFLLDAHTRITLDVLTETTRFGAERDALRDANVILMTGSQLSTVAALLELDGFARRIVLCPPDVQGRHLAGVAATAGAAVVVADRPVPELQGVGVQCVIPGDPVPMPAAAATAGMRPATEWVLFTSGTTGPPKMVAHTLRSLTGAISAVATAATDSVWCTFYDIRRYGGLQILLRALLGGGSMVLSAADEPVANFLQRAAGAGVTFISGTPTHWRRAMLSPAATALAPQNVRMSGEAADQAILDRLRSIYPAVRIAHAFASTEAGVAFEVADGLAGFPAALIGQERDGVAMRIEDGTLRIRSPRAADRYLGDAAEALAAPDGYIDTKDLVELRGDRYHFAGRKDGVINVGGLKVHPEEVEAVINVHPSVQMSLVKARRSPIIGAIVVADIVLAPAMGEITAADTSALEGDILEACRKALAWYKVPASIRIVPSLEMTASGKLTRARA